VFSCDKAPSTCAYGALTRDTASAESLDDISPASSHLLDRHVRQAPSEPALGAEYPLDQACRFELAVGVAHLPSLEQPASALGRTRGQITLDDRFEVIAGRDAQGRNIRARVAQRRSCLKRSANWLDGRRNSSPRSLVTGVNLEDMKRREGSSTRLPPSRVARIAVLTSCWALARKCLVEFPAAAKAAQSHPSAVYQSACCRRSREWSSHSSNFRTDLLEEGSNRHKRQESRNRQVRG